MAEDIKILSGTDLEPYREKWQELENSAEQRNLFFSWSWCKHWWQIYAGKAEFRIITIQDGAGKWLALWPFIQVPAIAGKGLWPFSYHTQDWSCPVLKEKGFNKLEEKLWEAVDLLLQESVFLWLPLLRQGGLLNKLGSVSARKIIRKSAMRSLIVFPEQPQDREVFVQEKWGKKQSKNISYLHRKLEEQGKPRFHVVSSSEFDEYFPHILKIESNSWKTKERVSLFSTQGVDSLYSFILPSLIEEKKIRLTLLMFDAEAIAYEIGFLDSDSYGMHNLAFDQNYERLSPGKLLMNHNLEWANQQGFKIFDFLQGNNEYKKRLATDEEELTEASIFAKNPKGWINYKIIQWAQKKKANTRSLTSG